VDTTGANALEAVETGDGERREVAAAEEMDTWDDKEKRGVASAEDSVALDWAAADALDMTPIELSMEVRGISKALDVAAGGVTVDFNVTVEVTVSVTVTTTGAAHDVARGAGADVATMVLSVVEVVFHDN